MADDGFATKNMADLLGVLAHPERIRIVQELRAGERDVNTLQKILAVPHSRVSQNLSLMRSHRLVSERREGRHVFYRLLQPKLADWLLQGYEFLEGGATLQDELRMAVGRARAMWASSTDDPASQ